MPLPDLYPWLDSVWSQIQTARDRLPHALLIGGPAGLGKHIFATTLAEGLLCHSPLGDGKPCGQCKSCKLYKVGNHPDFRLTQKEEDASMIVVDQVRELINFMSMRPHTSQRKLVVLAPAEAMNINAANALLKILEEPPADSILILVSDNPQSLSATIRSRCTKIAINPPSLDEGIQWLKSEGIESQVARDLLAAAAGAPLRACELEQQGFSKARNMMLTDLESLQARTGDPVSCATRWKKIGAGFCLGWLSGLLADLVKLTYMQSESAHLNNPSLHETLQIMSGKSKTAALIDLYEKTVEAAHFATTPLDDTLLIEDILIGWSKTSI